MAPTGRAAKVMSGAAGKNAFTIHRSLYRPSVSNGGVANFVLSNNPHKNTTFVVDEAGLVATNNDSTLGGNSLLEDLLTYVFSDPSNGLVLVGDPAQLPPVGQPQSPALSADWFIGAGINATEHTLRMVVRQALDSHILKNATQLRELIESDSSELPKLIPGKILSKSRTDITCKKSLNSSTLQEAKEIPWLFEATKKPTTTTKAFEVESNFKKIKLVLATNSW